MLVGVEVGVRHGGLYRSTSVPLPDPTAHTSLVDTAATPLSTLYELVLGLETTDHDVPSQCSTSVWYALPFMYCPTAHTSLADTAATPLRVPLLGLSTTDHTGAQG